MKNLIYERYKYWRGELQNYEKDGCKVGKVFNYYRYVLYCYYNFFFFGIVIKKKNKFEN